MACFVLNGYFMRITAGESKGQQSWVESAITQDISATRFQAPHLIDRCTFHSDFSNSPLIPDKPAPRNLGSLSHYS